MGRGISRSMGAHYESVFGTSVVNERARGYSGPDISDHGPGGPVGRGGDCGDRREGRGVQRAIQTFGRCSRTRNASVGLVVTRMRTKGSNVAGIANSQLVTQVYRVVKYFLQGRRVSLEVYSESVSRSLDAVRLSLWLLFYILGPEMAVPGHTEVPFLLVHTHSLFQSRMPQRRRPSDSHSMTGCDLLNRRLKRRRQPPPLPPQCPPLPPRCPPLPPPAVRRQRIRLLPPPPPVRQQLRHRRLSRSCGNSRLISGPAAAARHQPKQPDPRPRLQRCLLR
jgi:hypothetical protein